MTNAEKFEKVFGIKIKDTCPADPCEIVDRNICVIWRERINNE